MRRVRVELARNFDPHPALSRRPLPEGEALLVRRFHDQTNDRVSVLSTDAPHWFHASRPVSRLESVIKARPSRPLGQAKREPGLTAGRIQKQRLPPKKGSGGLGKKNGCPRPAPPPGGTPPIQMRLVSIG